MLQFKNMVNPKKVVIFSHGFGLRKDNRGLFTLLGKEIEGLGFETVYFDYNKYDPKTKKLYTIPFSAQAKKLQRVIDQVSDRYPNYKIYIIGQSQGSFIPALCNTKRIDKIIGMSPFFHTDMKDIMRRYTKSKENVLNFSGISIRRRTDGSITIIPPEYWKERFETDVVSLYNSLALKTDLVLISPLQDEIMDIMDLRKIKHASIINLDGDHDFSSEYRFDLVKTVLNQLV